MTMCRRCRHGVGSSSAMSRTPGCFRPRSRRARVLAPSTWAMYDVPAVWLRCSRPWSTRRSGPLTWSALLPPPIRPGSPSASPSVRTCPHGCAGTAGSRHVARGRSQPAPGPGSACSSRRRRSSTPSPASCMSIWPPGSSPSSATCPVRPSLSARPEVASSSLMRPVQRLPSPPSQVTRRSAFGRRLPGAHGLLAKAKAKAAAVAARHTTGWRLRFLRCRVVERRPLIAMVVNNAVAHDARVIKTAMTMARAGADVRVLGVSASGRHERAASGSAVFERLPVLPPRSMSPGYAWWAATRRFGRVFPAESWKQSIPVTGYYRRAFLPALRELAPDVVHVHDIHLLATVDEYAERADRRPHIVYDAHEFVAGLAVSGARTQRSVDGWAALERQFIGSADRVITVADGLAERLQVLHHLARRPAVVHNAPIAWGADAGSSRSLRDERE